MPRHNVDLYGHVLLDNKDARLEGEVNRLAKRYAVARDHKGQEARALSLRAEVVTRALSFFYVVGRDLDPKLDVTFDDVLVDTLTWVLDRYDPERGAFTYFVRYKYKRMVKSTAEKEHAHQQRFVELVEQSKDDVDSYEDGLPYEDEQSSTSAEVEDALAALAADEADLADNETDRVESAVAEFLTLVIGFLDHTPDKSHDDRAKLYLRMNFAEWTTYAVKVQPVYEDCRPFERQQRRIFSAAETGFMDMYMADLCRTVRRLWLTELKDGYGEIIKLDDERLLRKKAPAPWKLAIAVHLEYLRTLGIKVTSGVISQHRATFKALKEQLTALE